MKSAFQKISRVRSVTGGTTWYLSKDCLLAAKRTMYAVEYRRFYLRDLECIVVWPSRSWRFRLIIPAAVLVVLGACLWQWVNSTAGAIFAVLGLVWAVLELALGPTAGSRVRATGATVDMPLVNRTRRARRVLAKIDAAVRVTRNVNEQMRVSANITQSSEPSVQTGSEVASATATMSETAQTNGS